MQGLPKSDVSGPCLLSRQLLNTRTLHHSSLPGLPVHFTLDSALSGLLPVNEVQIHPYLERDDSFDSKPTRTLILLQCMDGIDNSCETLPVCGLARTGIENWPDLL